MTSMKKNKEQVGLFKLVFTHNWEDPACDHAALKIKSKDSVLAITSGGCNVLGFLLFDPEIIYSIDINPSQSYLLELKIAAIKNLDFEEFISFSGIQSCDDRIHLYEKIRSDLCTDAQAFWNDHTEIIRKGFIMQGKYEWFIQFAGRFIRLLQGRKRVMGLFEEKSQTEQEDYFDKIWNTKRFRFLFKILFNKRMLARKGLVADYFHFDDGSTSFAESFYNRSKKAFRTLPVKGNYFLSLYLLGKYRNDQEVPAYLKKENYDIIKARIDRIRIQTAEAQKWLESMPERSIDCFALSNICELMSEKETKQLFTAVSKTARDGARIIFRNLMIPREPPVELQSKIIKDETLSRKIYENDRSFVYGKVMAYTVNNKY
jgi:S-adenosylmethionine-diacylglycerol 3-amino-3-carboxypropyl transferase